MRRTTRIAVPLLAAAAVSILTGCRPKEMQRCVDENGNVVDDKLCGDQPAQYVQQPDGHGGYIPHPIYRYYYGGGGSYGIGSRVYGGGYSAESGHSYSTGVSRGGFGAHFGGGS